MTKKRLLLFASFIVIAIGILFVSKSQTPGTNIPGGSTLPETTPTASPPFVVQKVDLPSSVQNLAPSTIFTPPKKTVPDPGSIYTYKPKQLDIAALGLELARQLGIDEPLQKAPGSPAHYYAVAGASQFDITQSPHIFSFSQQLNNLTVDDVFTYGEAETAAREFLANHGLLDNSISLSLAGKEYVNTDGIVFSPATDYKKPLATHLSFHILLDSHPVFIQTGKPATIDIYITKKGVVRVSGTLLRVERDSQSSILPPEQAYQSLSQNNGTLIYVGGYGTREEREGTLQTASVSQTYLREGFFGYYFVNSSSILPVYVFEGNTGTGPSLTTRFVVAAEKTR